MNKRALNAYMPSSLLAIELQLINHSTYQPLINDWLEMSNQFLSAIIYTTEMQ
jgi:hypothetical protein